MRNPSNRAPERRVLNPLDDARVDRDSHQVFLRQPRSTDAAALTPVLSQRERVQN